MYSCVVVILLTVWPYIRNFVKKFLYKCMPYINLSSSGGNSFFDSFLKFTMLQGYHEPESGLIYYMEIFKYCNQN